jgi:hypothetical protein
MQSGISAGFLFLAAGATAVAIDLHGPFWRQWVTLGSFVAMAIAFALAPLRCPKGWHHEGVRPTGEYDCIRKPVGPDWPGYAYPDRSVVPPGRLQAQIYCTGGAVPVVVDERTIGCQRIP